MEIFFDSKKHDLEQVGFLRPPKRSIDLFQPFIDCQRHTVNAAWIAQFTTSDFSTLSDIYNYTILAIGRIR